MTLEEINARLKEIDDEVAELEDRAEQSDVSDEDREADASRFDELAAEGDQLVGDRETEMARQAKLERIRVAARDPRNVEAGEPGGDPKVDPVPGMAGDPFDLDAVRAASPSELRARARTALEQVRAVDDEARAEATRKLDTMRDPKGVLPGLILRTSSDVYRSAFAKYMAGLAGTMTPDETAAVAEVDQFRAAFGLTQSGYSAPAVIDPTVISTAAGSVNPFRQVARVVSITSNSWKAIQSAGITASWDAESAEVSDDTPTYAQPEVTVYKAAAFARGTIEGIEDWATAGQELTRDFVLAKDTLEASAFATGTGSAQPFGVTKALDGAGVTIELAPATAEVFVLADAINVTKSLTPRSKASPALAMLAHQGTINKIRDLASDAAYDGVLKDPTLGNPGFFQGVPLYEASTMRDYDDLDAAASADNFLIVAGDWDQFVIVDRIGLSVSFVPHLFATATNLPSGESGWYAHWRVGSDVIDNNSFRMLSIPTTA